MGRVVERRFVMAVFEVQGCGNEEVRGMVEMEVGEKLGTDRFVGEIG
jgi:hypothetical protein